MSIEPVAYTHQLLMQTLHERDARAHIFLTTAAVVRPYCLVA